MTGQTFKEPPIRGDACSQLLQTLARDVGLKMTATGKGDEDARGIVTRAFNAELSANEIWKGVAEMFQMAEYGELPERMKAQLAGIILRSRANVELGAKR